VNHDTAAGSYRAVTLGSTDAGSAGCPGSACARQGASVPIMTITLKVNHDVLPGCVSRRPVVFKDVVSLPCSWHVLRCCIQPFCGERLHALEATTICPTRTTQVNLLVVGMVTPNSMQFVTREAARIDGFVSAAGDALFETGYVDPIVDASYHSRSGHEARAAAADIAASILEVGWHQRIAADIGALWDANQVRLQSLGCCLTSNNFISQQHSPSPSPIA